jgi:hypothetical protein
VRERERETLGKEKKRGVRWIGIGIGIGKGMAGIG